MTRSRFKCTRDARATADILLEYTRGWRATADPRVEYARDSRAANAAHLDEWLWRWGSYDYIKMLCPLDLRLSSIDRYRARNMAPHWADVAVVGPALSRYRAALSVSSSRCSPGSLKIPTQPFAPRGPDYKLR